MIAECKKIVGESNKKAMRVRHPEDENGEPAEKRQKLESDESKDSKDDDDQKGIVSPGMAKRILRRIKLFQEIKLCLNDVQLEDKLDSIDRTPPVNWWVIPLHDRYLLEYVYRYGIGTNEWTQLLENKECVFYVNEDDTTDYK